nr:Flp family type IVb pilin [uncultured Rhodopila sp.]
MLSTIKSSIALYISALNEDRDAAGALEYALLVSFIAVAVIVGVTKFGTSLSNFFSTMSTVIGGLAT